MKILVQILVKFLNQIFKLDDLESAYDYYGNYDYVNPVVDAAMMKRMPQKAQIPKNLIKAMKTNNINFPF